MNKQQAHKLVRQTLTHQFDKGPFFNLTGNILHSIDQAKAASWNHQYVKDAFKDHIDRFERLGTYTSPEKEALDVLVVHVTKDSKLERARTALRNFVADHLKQRDGKDAALVAFVSPAETQWRFSYVKMEYATIEKEDGKIGVEARLTPARRFSYIVGEGESCHTAQTRFLSLLQNTDSDPKLADIEEAFSVEAVTKEFYQEYCRLFEKIERALRKLAADEKRTKDEFEENRISTVDFAKKSMGQIVFLYFLQKKGWLGVAKGAEWGTGPRDFLRKLVRGEYGSYSNFFNDVLEPLFYDTLASDRGHEAWCTHFKCRIPFLDGGLFEPLGNYDWRRVNINLPDKLFTNSDRIDEGVTGSGVLDLFDRYNFTVNEAEPLEKEVAIDPEMLGKVFENLIEENRRKGLGQFYTPREIVHYMCQQGLVNYLDAHLNTRPLALLSPKPRQDTLLGEPEPEQTVLEASAVVPREDLETFIHLGEQYSFYEAAKQSGTIGRDYPKPPKSIQAHARQIDDLLEEITVCDPAVGSGAFPVGMMTEVVRARCALTPYFNDFHERTPYLFKRHAIQRCLYGVDIDSGAIEIAKLRLWLSLVVDEEEVNHIKPLPNLDYKLVAGNSLLGFPFKTEGLQDVERLIDRHVDEPDREEKAKLKHEIDSKLNKCLAASENTLGYKVDFDFHVHFSEVFRRGGGFDVTIGNPPYVRADEQSEDHKRLRERILASRQYETLWEKWDLFVPFIEKAYKLLRPGGVTTLIVSDAFCHSKYAQKPQKWFLENAIVKRLDFCSDLQIFEAAVHNLIYCFRCAEGTHNVPERRVHREAFGNVTVLPSDQQAKLTYRAFFPEDKAARRFGASTVTLDTICYVSYGLRPNSDENEAKGEFSTADLVSGTRDRVHCRPYIEGKHLGPWLPVTNLWIEWGTRRAPSRFCRPTFPELYTVPEKILAQRSPGPDPVISFDSEQLVFTPASVGFVSWHALEGVRNNSLKKAARYRGEKPPRPDLPKREELEATSRRLPLKYVLGVMNSATAREFLRANRRSNIHLYPDDWKQLPIPDVPPEKQAPVVKVVDQILKAKRRSIDADVTPLERELDSLVSKLYGSTVEEVALVEASPRSAGADLSL